MLAQQKSEINYLSTDEKITQGAPVGSQIFVFN